MTGGQPADGAERADAAPCEAASREVPPERRGWRAGMRPSGRNVALYLALLVGAAIVLGGGVAHQFGFDGSRFARLLMPGVYVIGAVGMMRRAGR